MPAPARKQYDHRIRQAVVETGDAYPFPKLSIPDPTRRSWLSRGVASVVTLDDRDAEVVELHTRIAKLEKRIAILVAVVRLLVTLVRARSRQPHVNEQEGIARMKAVCYLYSSCRRQKS